MSDTERLIQVIGEICKILFGHGYADFASRLNEQALILSSTASSPDSMREARERLHRAVNGMGGLNDLWLPAASNSESVEIREELDELSDELYELTK